MVAKVLKVMIINEDNLKDIKPFKKIYKHIKASDGIKSKFLKDPIYFIGRWVGHRSIPVVFNFLLDKKHKIKDGDLHRLVFYALQKDPQNVAFLSKKDRTLGDIKEILPCLEYLAKKQNTDICNLVIGDYENKNIPKNRLLKLIVDNNATIIADIKESEKNILFKDLVRLPCRSKTVIKKFQEKMSKKGYSLFDNNENNETFLHYLFKEDRLPLANNLLHIFGDNVALQEDKYGKIPLQYFNKKSKSSLNKIYEMSIVANSYIADYERKKILSGCKDQISSGSSTFRL